MKTEYKHIHFKQLLTMGKTSRWECNNNHSGGRIGLIHWYRAWRQYCFEPAYGTVFNVSCLDDIKDFIRQLMSERKKVA